MSDDTDEFDWKAYRNGMRQLRKDRGEENRQRSSEDFLRALDTANANGLDLLCHSEVHYQLRDFKRTWLLNLYPGNGRVWGKGPRLNLESGWTLSDAVKAAIARK